MGQSRANPGSQIEWVGQGYPDQLSLKKILNGF